MTHLSPASGPPPRRGRAYGCALWAGVVLLCAGIAVDFTDIEASGLGPAALLFVDLAALSALLLPRRLRPAWLTAGVRAAVPALMSVGLNLALWAAGPSNDDLVRPGQIALLLCLVTVAVRGCATAWAAALSAAVLWAGLATLTLAGDLTPSDREGSVFVLTLGTAAFAGLGGFLRSTDRQRREAVSEVRRAERVEIAADLHDFVAHHVTGILVQTQMARLLAASDPGPAPDRLDPVLAGIEHSATEALASMRRLVGVLRTQGAEADGTAAPVRPVGDLAQLAELVDEFTRVGPRAELSRAPSVPAALPHEVEAAAFRVVQEALTNVRRHAGDATGVTVGLRFADNALQVSVRDDGQGSAALPHAARGGGYGLVGLAERVSALDGELTAGPRERGWEVLARLPVTGRAAGGVS